MTPIPNRPLAQTKYSEQNMLNTSFDEDFGVNSVEVLVYDPIAGTLNRMVQPGETLPTSGSNPSLVLGYTGSNLTTITKTINAVEYQKTLTYTGSDLTGISVWVQI